MCINLQRNGPDDLHSLVDELSVIYCNNPCWHATLEGAYWRPHARTLGSVEAAGRRLRCFMATDDTAGLIVEDGAAPEAFSRASLCLSAETTRLTISLEYMAPLPIPRCWALEASVTSI